MQRRGFLKAAAAGLGAFLTAGVLPAAQERLRVASDGKFGPGLGGNDVRWHRTSASPMSVDGAIRFPSCTDQQVELTHALVPGLEGPIRLDPASGKARRLRAAWSYESEEDFRSMYGLDSGYIYTPYLNLE